MTTKKEPVQVKQILTSPTATSVSDAVRTAMRTDGSVLMQFISDTPEFQVENHRTVLAPELTRKLIENLCQIVNYYPTKKTADKKQSSK
ncbi:MAG: hypothetical protein HQ517_10765 [SAR324 cluster bacterium]|nr:hypothetical protein [SAR324 cluster bacterium]